MDDFLSAIFILGLGILATIICLIVVSGALVLIVIILIFCVIAMAFDAVKSSAIHLFAKKSESFDIKKT